MCVHACGVCVCVRVCNLYLISGFRAGGGGGGGVSVSCNTYWPYKVPGGSYRNHIVSSLLAYQPQY